MPRPDASDQYRLSPCLCSECNHMGQSRRCGGCYEGPLCEKCMEEHIKFHCAGIEDLGPGPEEGATS